MKSRRENRVTYYSKEDMSGEMREQRETPLFEAVMNYAKGRKISFHTPGHKHGVSIPQEFRNFVGEKIFETNFFDNLRKKLKSAETPNTESA